MVMGLWYCFDCDVTKPCIFVVPHHNRDDNPSLCPWKNRPEGTVLKADWVNGDDNEKCSG